MKCLKTINPNPDLSFHLTFIFFAIFIMAFKLYLQNLSSLVHLSSLIKIPHFPLTSNQHFILLHAIMHHITKLLNISLDKYLLSVHMIASMTILALATVYIIWFRFSWSRNINKCLMSEFALKHLRVSKKHYEGIRFFVMLRACVSKYLATFRDIPSVPSKESDPILEDGNDGVSRNISSRI